MSKIYPNYMVYAGECRCSVQSETKCAQIFAKGTSITRDFLEKIDDDLATGQASVCGRSVETRNLWVLCGLSVLFLSSCCGMGLMFGTDKFDDYVLSHMALVNNSIGYQLWKGPLVKTLLRVYVYNYTNVDDYEFGDDEKLHVEEIGPYVYEETVEKINVKFLPNGTVSYQEKREHRFRADLSKGRSQNDVVIVPNLPLLSAAALGKDYLYPVRLMMSGAFEQLDAKPFLNVTVGKFIWGYDDVFYSVIKTILSFYKRLPFEKFGILAARTGTSEDVFTMHTGVTDKNKIMQFDTYNRKTHLPYWKTEQCNEVRGSDGIAFPVDDVRQRKPVVIFHKDLGRTVKLVYEKDVTILNGKVTAAKYVVPKNTFDAPESNAENECYCDRNSDECLQGVFSTSVCNLGAPTYVSFPHFYNADSDIQEGVSGLSKTKRPDDYMYIHPNMGFTMGGRTGLQLNVQVQKSIGMKQLEMFEDDVMLPIALIELGLDAVDLPEVVIGNIYMASITVPAIELCLKYGSLLGAIITLISILIIVQAKVPVRHFKDLER